MGVPERGAVARGAAAAVLLRDGGCVEGVSTLLGARV